eukprot:gb/GECG01012565.1/.p1 GENE.gb/GECG01012565.1/~~gb/GECG01012565.1/.p1  ORF type:complete len:586 (+),score=56.81 gb/GECG01012565.1/:1-1758(+)
MEILPQDHREEGMSLGSSACPPQEEPELWPQLYTRLPAPSSPLGEASQEAVHDETMGFSPSFYHYFDPIDSTQECPSCRQKQHGKKTGVEPTTLEGADVSGPHSHRHLDDCTGCCSHSQYQVFMGQQNALSQQKRAKGPESDLSFRSKSGNSVPSFSTLSLLAQHHELEKPQKKANEESREAMKRGRARSHSFRCADRGQYSCCADLHSRCGIWNPCCNCLFSAFPDIMIIQEIFSFLDKGSLLAAAQVCRRWNFLANSPKLWRQIVISDTSDTGKKSNSMINLLAKRSPSINSLSLRAPKFEPTTRDLDLGSLYLTNLVKVDLSGMKRISGDLVYSLLRYTRKLEVLCLDGVAKMDDTSLQNLIRHNTQLRDLNIARCRLISDDTLRFCAEEDVKLNHLNVTSCTGVSIASVAEYLEKSKHSLVSLRIAGIKWLRDQHSVDRLMRSIAFHCPHLHELDISSRDTMLGNRLVSDTHLGWMTNGSLSNLQVLRTRGLRGISAPGFCDFVRVVGPQLRVLDLGYCRTVDDTVIRTIADSCPRLENLNLCNIKTITDRGGPHLRGMAALKKLNVEGCSGMSTEFSLGQ